MGLGLRPPPMGAPMGGYGPPGHAQGPPLSALSANGLPPQGFPPPMSNGPKLTAFVGSISPGIPDSFLTQLLSVSVVGRYRMASRILTPQS